jgi:raffinose/stachyose/melibiose transport system substrate-binding protein
VNVLEKIDSLKPYYQEGYAAFNYSDMQALLATGQVAMTFDGIWAAKSYESVNPDLKTGLFLAPAEEAGVEPMAYVYVDGGYALNAATEHREEGLALLRFASTTDFADIFVDIQGDMSSVPGAQTRPDQEKLAEALELSEKALTHLFWVRSPFNAGQPSAASLLNSGLEGLMSGELTPEELAATIQDGVATWYPPFQD